LAEFLQKLIDLLPKIGITRLANITGLDNVGIPVVNCIRPNSKHLTVAQGKGVTLEDAKISAIMESIEGYCAENILDSDIIGTYSELKKSFNLLDPSNISKGLYQFNKDNYHAIWLPAQNLIDNKAVYLAAGNVCLNTVDFPARAIFGATSDGLAAGSTRENAILHGLYEIIERAALAEWWKLPFLAKQKTQIKLSSIVDNLNQPLLKKFQQANVSVAIFKVDSKVKIPVYFCIISGNDFSRNIGQFCGSGAHASAQIALSRALLEAAQSRLTWIAGTRDEVFPEYYQNKKALIWQDFSDQGLEFSPEHKIKNLSELLSNLAKYFQEIILFDHANSDLNIPVVHVLIPGFSV